MLSKHTPDGQGFHVSSGEKTLITIFIVLVHWPAHYLPVMCQNNIFHKFITTNLVEKVSLSTHIHMQSNRHYSVIRVI